MNIKSQRRHYPAFLAKIFLATCCVGTALATVPIPFLNERTLIDQLASGARSAAPDAALRVLEAIAANRLGTVDRQTITSLGLKPDVLNSVNFREESVREHALLKLGETGLPEAEAFLKVEAEKVSRLQRAARVAHLNVSVHLMANPSDQIAALERALFVKTHSVGDDSVRSWAAVELCNRGSQQSRSLIEKSILALDPFQSGKDALRLCGMKLDLLSSSPSRTTALIAGLRIPDPFDDRPFNTWVIEELFKTGSPEAHAALRTYALEMGPPVPDGPNMTPTQRLQRQILGRLPKAQ